MTRHLRAGIAVLATILSLAAALATGPAAHASRPGEPACPSCRYHINFVYRSGTIVLWKTTSQYSWLVNAAGAVKRGISQKSGYSSIWLSDDFTGARVDVHFCSTGRQCDAKVHDGAYGIDRDDWFETSTSTNCHTLPSPYGPEGSDLAYWLLDVGDAYRGSLGSAKIVAPSHNQLLYLSPHHGCHH